MSTAAPLEPLGTLDYSSSPKFARVRRWRRRIILGALFVAVAVPIYRHRESLTRRANWLYWSHRCATHRMPESIDLIVTDPARAQHLLDTDPDYVRQPANTGFPASAPTGPVALYVPRAWRKLVEVDGRAAWLERRGLAEYEPVVFLGTLSRPDGTPRILIMRGARTNGFQLLDLTSVLALPRPRLSDPLPSQVGSGGAWANGIYRPAQLRRGTVDPKNPAHLVLEFDVYSFSDERKVDASGTIDAYLENDDSITFELRETAELSRLGIKLGRTRMSGVIPPAAFRRWR